MPLGLPYPHRALARLGGVSIFAVATAIKMTSNMSVVISLLL